MAHKIYKSFQEMYECMFGNKLVTPEVCDAAKRLYERSGGKITTKKPRAHGKTYNVMQVVRDNQ